MADEKFITMKQLREFAVSADARLDDLEASKVFWAEYGVTTYDEIKAAANAGNFVACANEGYRYALVYDPSGEGEYTFSKCDSTSIAVIQCSETSGWSEVTIVSIASTEYVANAIGDAIGGSY